MTKKENNMTTVLNGRNGVAIAAISAITLIVCLDIITSRDYSLTTMKDGTIELKPKQ